MKGNSDYSPEVIKQSNGKTQIRFNITESVKEEINGVTRTSYDFDYVEIEGELTRAKIIDAVITNVHSKDVEIALINDELTSPGTTPYVEYQTLRAHAKEIASAILTYQAPAIVVTAKAQSFNNNFPSWKAVSEAIDAATTLAAMKVIVKKMARVVYWLAKGTEE